MENIPKYQALAALLREQIEQGLLRPGDRLPSENELARSFAISRQTARQAIGLLEREGTVSRRRGSGTFLAPRAPSGAQNIGVVMTYLDSYIFPEIIRGIEHVLTGCGYGMLLYMTHNRPDGEAGALKSIAENRVHGLIVEPAKSGFPCLSHSAYRAMGEKGMPIVFLNARYPGLDYPCVSLDDRAAGALAARHLLDMGHRKIAGMFKADDLQGHMRYLGYAQALAEAGLECDASRVLWFTTEDMPHLSKDMGRVLRYLSGSSALVCYNDNVAYPLCAQLAMRGVRVPDDLSVVGVDNAEPPFPGGPGLTTIDNPPRRLGEAAAKALLKLTRDPRASAGVSFKPVLVERASVKRI